MPMILTEANPMPGVSLASQSFPGHDELCPDGPRREIDYPPQLS